MYCCFITQTLLKYQVTEMKVAVIGGGTGGLVTLKYLLQAHEFLPTKPIEVRLFEACSEIGGTFRHRSYEDAEVFAVICVDSSHILVTDISYSKSLRSI